jgi:hypothetical protein
MRSNKLFDGIGHYHGPAEEKNEEIDFLELFYEFNYCNTVML